MNKNLKKLWKETKIIKIAYFAGGICLEKLFWKKSENGKIDQKESSETVQGAKRKAFVKKR